LWRSPAQLVRYTRPRRRKILLDSPQKITLSLALSNLAIKATETNKCDLMTGRPTYEERRFQSTPQFL